MLLLCYWVGAQLSVQGECVLHSSTRFSDIPASHITIHSNAVPVSVSCHCQHYHRIRCCHCDPHCHHLCQQQPNCYPQSSLYDRYQAGEVVLVEPDLTRVGIFSLWSVLHVSRMSCETIPRTTLSDKILQPEMALVAI